MLCCSIGVFLLSQLYAAVIGLRALFFGERDDLDMQPRRSGAVLAFSRPRFALATMIGLTGLTVAYAVSSSTVAHAESWIPIVSSICGSLQR